VSTTENFIPIVRESTLADAPLLAEHLRLADKDEIYAARGIGPNEALEICVVDSTKCFTVLNGNIPIAMFGYLHVNDETAQVWMLGSDELTQNKKWFVRESKGWLIDFAKQYRVIYNFIDARNELHIKWIGRMGFKIVESVPDYGFEKRLFLKFVMGEV
jgi:hypothetical protein